MTYRETPLHPQQVWSVLATWLGKGGRVIMIDRDMHMAEHNYIFIHIPKTAGRSIWTALGLKINNQHKTIADYCKELSEPVVRSRFKFTCVRNPWDRAVSWWSFFGSGGPKREEFDVWLKRMGRWYHGVPGRRFPLDQMSFLRTAGGELLVDQFIRFEHLEEDFAPIAKRFGVTDKLPKIGKRDREMNRRMREAMFRTKHADRAPLLAPDDYHDAYQSQESIDIVARLDAETIKRFGYTFK